MKPREYCCCAIPTVNAGIYATLIEQFVLGIVVGVLSVATPSIVGAATPSFAPWILAILCFVAAAVQVFGFIGVRGEKAIMYRRYVTLHVLSTVATFAVAAVWIIISAARHSTAQSNCETQFFADDDTNSEGQILCNVFPWVDVGIMGGLWVFLAVVQFYLYVVISSYGASQRRDHEKYNQLYDTSNTLPGDNIPMNSRNDPWDSRGSVESLGPIDHKYGHVRQDSSASVADVLSAPVQHPKDVFSSTNYGYSDATYPPPNQYVGRRPSKGGASSHPATTQTQEGDFSSYTGGYHTGNGHHIRGYSGQI